jgi:hypothetical protein
MAEMTTYINYGNMPLNEVLREMYPWLTEEQSREIEHEARYAQAKKARDMAIARKPLT